MTHIWIRGEQRLNEGRVGVSPAGVKALIEAGYKITIEYNPARAIPLTEYPTVDTAPMGSWPGAPHDAVIMGLKELPDDASPQPRRLMLFRASK
jgi:saccharopine dehydrogenase (NAD+, L-lysine-forming)